jgi:tRNA 2-selenouridine synthase
MKRKETLSIADFRSASGPILDVRSPGEFEHGHIPGAVSFPLFTDAERAEVGLCYKERGRSAAIELGFDLVGLRLGDMVRRAREIASGKAIRVHCWRGGLRSRGVAWCLQTAGFRVGTLDGGYKSYRRWCRQIVGMPRSINILGGLTGTGKTHILKALQEQGEQVLDLEGLASHRGSNFGGLGMPTQPSTQHFENLVAECLVRFDPARPVWIESESARIGTCWVAEGLYCQMKSAPTIEIIRPLDERLDILLEMYGRIDKAELIEATKRIRKYLGGQRTQGAIYQIEKNDLREACRIILDYYDRSYQSDLKRRPMSVPVLDISDLSAQEAAKLLIGQSPFSR